MNSGVLKHIHFLSLLCCADDDQKLALLKTMPMKQYKILIECVYNVLYGVYEMSQRDKKKLGEYKDVIRRLTDKTTTYEQRKRLLLRYHFILPLIVNTILSDKGNGTSDDFDSEAEI